MFDDEAMTATTDRRYQYADLDQLMALQTGDAKHDNAATSTLDVLWVLYDEVLDVGPDRVDDPRRDRFLLSKGHGPMAYYAVLAATGFISRERLARFGGFGSSLGYHPDRNLIPGVEISSGSLGHGLPLAVGTALALRAQDIDSRVVVLVGDAELDEGSNAEAVEFAAAAALTALTVVALDNHSASWPWRDGLESRFEVAGWRAARVDGHDRTALAAALARDVGGGGPDVVVADVAAKS